MAVPQLEISEREPDNNENANADISTNIDISADNEPDISISNHVTDARTAMDTTTTDPINPTTTDISTTDDFNSTIAPATSPAPSSTPSPSPAPANSPPTNSPTTTTTTTNPTQEEKEITTLRTRLHHAEAALSSWRARAEAAEQRVLQLELKIALGLGVGGGGRGLREGLGLGAAEMGVVVDGEGQARVVDRAGFGLVGEGPLELGKEGYGLVGGVVGEGKDSVVVMVEGMDLVEGKGDNVVGVKDLGEMKGEGEGAVVVVVAAA
ncbi:hypothetical protein C8A05DRAFT_34048 [Staphylotrichum tortipilum]|uniref:Uncharacterized protein n=1 Tax=Staphylotrichum tortipilum TaxID=2831512 RepID=A0AAN6RTD1_9PEZI|nr:hypothetical protein C8A05DRAFT_34048 [Staphylotrichum longicolle]